jgi:uncharacterized phiE125 gp8 family phage protein
MIATRLTEPVAEPLLLADTKTFLRVSSADDDALITQLIRSARDAVEKQTALCLIDQSWRLVLDSWPVSGCISVPVRPLKTVTAIRVLDRNAIATTVAVSNVDVVQAAQTLRLKAVLPMPDRMMGGIEIDISAGFGAAGTSVPGALLQAMRLMIAFWYENRGDAGVSEAQPEAAMKLMAPFRRRRLAQ